VPRTYIAILIVYYTTGMTHIKKKNNDPTNCTWYLRYKRKHLPQTGQPSKRQHCGAFALPLLPWYSSTIFFFCFADLASRYNQVKNAQLIPSIFRQPIHVSDVSRPIIRSSNLTRTTYSHLKRIIRTNWCIRRVVTPGDGTRYARNMYRLPKYTGNKFCIQLVFSLRVLHTPGACLALKYLVWKAQAPNYTVI